MNGQKLALAALLVVSAALLTQSTTEADHDRFQYKFPCRAWSVEQDECELTQGAHGNAYDLVIYPPAGESPGIYAISEGTFVGYLSDADQCTWFTDPVTPNAGKFAVVDDIHGRRLIYAHLSTFGDLQEGQRVLQGDFIGLQGDTGRTQECGDHLHLGGIVGVAYIDGVSSSEFVNVHPHPTFASTNAPVGASNSPGEAIRERYLDLGSASSSWSVVGWTEYFSTDNAGCGSSLPCRLYVSYVPDPLAGHWGSRQDFRNHPAEGGFQYSSIMVGRWAMNDAYWVRPLFYTAWVFRGQVAGTSTRFNIGMPLMDRSEVPSDACPASSGCVRYQRFHLGYIWEHQVDGISTVFCPDIHPAYPYQDGAVTVGDIGAVIGKFGRNDAGLAPYASWFDAWYDIDGDGAITIGDIGRVVQGFGQVCRPIG